MTFTVGVHLRYRGRLPTLSDVLHIVTPNQYPDYFSLTRTAESIYYLGNLLLQTKTLSLLAFLKVNEKLELLVAHLRFSLHCIWTILVLKVNLS